LLSVKKNFTDDLKSPHLENRQKKYTDFQYCQKNLNSSKLIGGNELVGSVHFLGLPLYFSCGKSSP